ncbi:DNA translocase FtsK 4TM domain-containing protein [Candidatus Halobeggiatoa sp. HSG11]|nr:DNA translocase FtsK 4TM domain-containing protein [Candidatus Halobeggiatoa sp. HSG11]
MQKSQARRNIRKKITKENKPIKYSLQEIVLISFYFLGLYLFISLFTYYGGDPGWGHSGTEEEIQNIGGMFGAIFADVFLNLFGYFAYLFPIMVGYMGWLLYKGRHHEIFSEPKNLLMPSFGFLITLMAGCGLAIVHFTSEHTLLPTHAGGVLGQWVGNNLVAIVNPLGATLILLALFFAGVTLLTGLSWMRLADVVGYYTLIWLPVIKKQLSTQFLPWLSTNTKKTLRTTKHLSQVAGTNTKKWSKNAYGNWQKRRIEWREERKRYAEEYDDEYDEYEDEEYYDDEKKAVKPPPQPIVHKPATPSLLPSLKLLDATSNVINPPTIKSLSQRMVDAFASVGIEAEVISVQPGPVLTIYEVNSLTSINTDHLDDLDLALAEVLKISKVKTIESQGETLHIEVPNWKRQPINLNELLVSTEYQTNLSPLAIALGKDIGGQPVIIDLTRIPHILIAGSDNLEKKTAINVFILSLLYKSAPEATRLLLIDNDDNDLAIYNDLPHLLTPIISDVQQVPNILLWCEQEMENRYKLMSSMGVRGIEDYNQALLLQNGADEQNESSENLYHIVIIINELSELMINDIEAQVEQSITNLTRKARAAGIYIVLATQYPTVNVITGLVKTNVPTRMAFKVTNKSESRTILGQIGAEDLLGQGDMLYMTAGTGMPVRVHGSTVSKSEVENVVTDLNSRATPKYVSLESEIH